MGQMRWPMGLERRVLEQKVLEQRVPERKALERHLMLHLPCWMVRCVLLLLLKVLYVRVRTKRARVMPWLDQRLAQWLQPRQ